VDLISNVTAANATVTERLNRYTNYFQHQGFSLLNAQGKAVKMIELTVVKQSAMLSYIDDFLLIGLLFAIALPLLLFVSRGHKQQKAAVIISDH
jgi:DHA2 family multidrug resistance protein